MNVKKSMLVVIPFLLFSCGNSDKIEINKAGYDKIKGAKSEYPKIITFDIEDYEKEKYFEVYLGSDGHEYQSHKESHLLSQWIHYIDCKFCAKRNKK